MKCQNCGSENAMRNKTYPRVELCPSCWDLSHDADRGCNGYTMPNGDPCIDALHIHHRNCECADCNAVEDSVN